MQRDTFCIFKKISRIYAGLKQLYEQDVVLRLHSAPNASPHPSVTTEARGCASAVRAAWCVSTVSARLPGKHPNSRAVEEQHLWSDQTGTKEISANARKALIFHSHPRPDLASSRALASPDF